VLAMAVLEDSAAFGPLASRQQRGPFRHGLILGRPSTPGVVARHSGTSKIIRPTCHREHRTSRPRGRALRTYLWWSDGPVSGACPGWVARCCSSVVRRRWCGRR
jgi:hypothetical protein